jgi:hypothetical protein
LTKRGSQIGEAGAAATPWRLGSLALRPECGRGVILRLDETVACYGWLSCDVG